MASVGIDANPASVLASQVKTNWTLSPDHVEELCRQVLAKVSPISEAFLLSDTPLFGPRSDLAALLPRCPRLPFPSAYANIAPIAL